MKNIISLMLSLLVLVSSFASVLGNDTVDNITATKVEVCKDCMPGIYVYLDEKFSLNQGQSAKVVDYNYMKITLNSIFYDCPVYLESSSANDATSELSSEQKVSCRRIANIQVDMPADCEEYQNGETCTGIGTEFTMVEGQTKELFGAELILLDLSSSSGIFLVKKPNQEDLVDIYIEPQEITISQGESTKYEITIIDKHPMTACALESYCEPPQPFTYRVHVNGLPFYINLPEYISLNPGEKKSFNLFVDTNQMVIDKIVPVEVSSEISEETQVESTKEIESTKTSHLGKKFKFSVKAVLIGSEEVSDKASAVLRVVQQIPPIMPPIFPNEDVSIQLYKGWNLISLPGKLIDFNGNTCNNKLIGFVYLKDQQKYVTIQDAKEILGSDFKKYLAKNAFWIYSYDFCSLNAKVDAADYSIDLSNGWNLVPIKKSMVGNSVGDLLQNCKAENFYKWDPKYQQWNQLDKARIFQEWEINQGFIVKNNDYCTISDYKTIVPPSMPE